MELELGLSSLQGLSILSVFKLQFPLITSNFNYLQLLEMENTGSLSQDFVKFIFR